MMNERSPYPPVASLCIEIKKPIVLSEKKKKKNENVLSIVANIPFLSIKQDCASGNCY